MHFYVIMRRESGDYITKQNTGDDGGDETMFVALATRYYSRKKALEAQGPNTCVCGPYPTDAYGGQPG